MKIILFIMLTLCGYAVNINEGITALNKKEYNKAFIIFNELADNGLAAGEFYLAHMYSLGHGVKMDDKKALELFIKASSQEFPPAYNALADLYLGGHGVEIDKKKAFELYKKAASYDTSPSHSQALHDVGYMYANGFGTKKDYNKALEYYEKSCEKEYFYACYSAGVYYADNGYSVEKNNTKARSYFKQACDDRYKEACIELEKGLEEKDFFKKRYIFFLLLAIILYLARYTKVFGRKINI